MIKKMAFIFFVSLSLSMSGCSFAKNQAHQQTKTASSLIDEWTPRHPEVLPKAFGLLQASLLLDKKHIPTYIELARYYIITGDMVSAKQNLDTAKSIDANNADVYVLLGHWYTLQKDYDEALRILDKAEQLGTNNPWLNANRATILDEQGHKDQAAALLLEVANSPNNTNKVKRYAYRYLGDYYWNSNDILNTEKFYNLYLPIAGDDASAYGNAARFYVCEKHDINKALELNEKALSLKKYRYALDTQEVAYWLEWADKYQQNPTKATDLLQKAQSYGSTNPLETVAVTCAYNQQWRNFSDIAIQAYQQRAIDLDKEDIADYYWINWDKANADKYSERYKDAQLPPRPDDSNVVPPIISH